MAVLLSLAVGCGGNEASAPPRVLDSPAAPTVTEEATTTTAPKAEPARRFVAAANATCKRMQQDAESVGAGGEPSVEEFRELVDKWLHAIDELDALVPPQDREQQFERMLAHYRNMARAFDAMAEAEDESVLAAVAAVAVEGQRGSRAARKAGLPACAFAPEIKQPAPDSQDLYEATRDLVPAKARILRDAALDCVALDMCWIDYRLKRSVDARMREARALLRRHGWKSISSGRTPTGGWWLMANRNDCEATLEFVGAKVPEHCGGRVTYGCSDNVSVKRVEVPDVLTGG